MNGYSSMALEKALPPTLALAEVVGMNPLEIAESSRLIVASYQELVSMALSMRHEEYRRIMLDVLRDSRVTFLDLYPTAASQEAIRDQLAEHGYMDSGDPVEELFPPHNLDPQPYISAPTSHHDWYNCHPGGMALTCAVNCRLGEYHTQIYQHHYGVPADRDLAVAALCIHEYPKAWLYQWREDGSYALEPRSFGGNVHTHDIYVVAEMLHRGAPAELVVAVAAAHLFGACETEEDGKETRFLWPGYEWVTKFLHAGAMLAQRDPEDAGLLEKGTDGRYVLPPQPVEIWNTHMSDMNWVYTSGAAHKFVYPLLARIASEDYGVSSPDSAEFLQLKNYVFAQVGQVGLYETLVRDGEDAVRGIVAALVSR